jgi:hypothetical protein
MQGLRPLLYARVNKMLPIEAHPEVLTAKRFIAYDYDQRFLDAYHAFIDSIENVFVRHHYQEDHDPQTYFSIKFIIDLLLDRLRQDHSMEEHTTESIYDDFEQPLADDVYEELVNFINSVKSPTGLEHVSRHISKDYFLLEVIFDQDSDAIYYVLDDGEDAE